MKKEIDKLNGFSKWYYGLLMSTPTALVLSTFAPWNTERVFQAYVTTMVPGLVYLTFKYRPLINKPPVAALQSTAKPKTVSFYGFDIRADLDYAFLAELEHEEGVPHGSHSYKACTRAECRRELQELDAIMRGEEPKKSKIESVITLPPPKKEPIGNAEYWFNEYGQACALHASITPKEARERGYHEAADRILGEIREQQNTWTGNQHKKYYPMFDRELEKQLRSIFSKDWSIENIYDASGGVINQLIITPEDTFMRVAWDRWYAKESKRKKRAQFLKEVEAERLRKEEDIKNKLAANNPVVPSEPEVITVYADNEPYAQFIQGLTAMKLYSEQLDEDDVV